jgi:hypothetical protein
MSLLAKENQGDTRVFGHLSAATEKKVAFTFVELWKCLLHNFIVYFVLSPISALVEPDDLQNFRTAKHLYHPTNYCVSSEHQLSDC